MSEYLENLMITREYLESLIVSEKTYVIPDTTITMARLKLKNGFDLVGKSACVDPDNFDEEKGKKYAREDAIEQLWPLEGYLLQQRIHDASIEEEEE